VANEEFEGQGDSFDKAVEDAFKKAGKQADWYKVKHWWVRIENPIREYKVIIKKGPGP
jgi:hypothetical protein